MWSLRSFCSRGENVGKTKRNTLLSETLSDCELMRRCSLTRAGIVLVDEVTAENKVKLDHTTTSARFLPLRLKLTNLSLFKIVLL